MKFQYPEFLYALFALIIPIVIHLFNFRRYKKIYFSNVRFLKDVEETTKAQSKLRQLLVLLSRILAISFLVFAFAQPYIPNKTGNADHEKKAISIYVDNSFSMQSDNRDGNRFEIARQYVYEIIKSFPATTEFQILDNTFKGKQQRLYSKEDALEIVDHLEIKPEVRTLDEILQRQKVVLNDTEVKDKRAYLVSDFQTSVFDFEGAKNDSFANVFLVPIAGESPSNKFIDSVWINSPAIQINTPLELSVRIKNTSNTDVEDSKLTAVINGVQKASTNYSAKAGQTIEKSISITLSEHGLQEGTISIENDPIDYDNSYPISFAINNTISIVELRGTNGSSNIELAYSKESLFSYSVLEEGSLDPNMISLADVIVVNELSNVSTGLISMLDQSIKQGASIVFIPTEKGDLLSYNELLKKMNADALGKLDSLNSSNGILNLNHIVFDQVFSSFPNKIEFPKIVKRFVWSPSSRSTQESIMSFTNQEPLIGNYPVEKGTFYTISFPLNENNSNFSKHALFLPLFYSIAFQSQNTSELSYVLGEDNFIEVSNVSIKTDQPLHVQSSNQKIDVIPPVEKTGKGVFLRVSNLALEAGHFRVLNGGIIEKGIALNYNRKESDITIPSPDQIELQIEKSGLKNFQLVQSDYSTISNTIQKINHGTLYWKWCIIFVLVFLGIEILLLRFLK